MMEHMRGHQTKQEGNPLYKHDQTAHQGETAIYSYEATRFFQDPLTRQIDEGVRINRSLTDSTCNLMNSRAEFRQGAVPRVEIIRGLRD